MMMCQVKISSYLLVVAAVLLAIAVQKGQGLHCWECSSEVWHEDYCDDPFDSSPRFLRLKNCGIPQQVDDRVYCYKIKISRPEVSDWTRNRGYYANITKRGCQWVKGGQDTRRTVCPSSGGHNVLQTCNFCDVDACNGSPPGLAPPSSLGLSLLAALSTLMLRFY